TLNRNRVIRQKAVIGQGVIAVISGKITVSFTNQEGKKQTEELEAGEVIVLTTSYEIRPAKDSVEKSQIDLVRGKVAEDVIDATLLISRYREGKDTKSLGDAGYILAKKQAPQLRIYRGSSSVKAVFNLQLNSLARDLGLNTEAVATQLISSLKPALLVIDIAEAGGRPTKQVVAELKAYDLLSQITADIKATEPKKAELKVEAEKLSEMIASIAKQQKVSFARMLAIFTNSLEPTVFIEGLSKPVSKPAKEVAGLVKNYPALALVATTYRIEHLSQAANGKTTTLKVEDIVSPEALSYMKDQAKIEIVLPEGGLEVDQGQYQVVKEHLDAVAEEAARKEHNHRGKVVDYFNQGFLPQEAAVYEQFVLKQFSQQGKTLKYILSSGIGANEMFSHLMAALHKAFSTSAIQWIVLDSPGQLRQIPADASDDNTLVIEFSRSGETQETLKILELTQNRFSKRLVYANKGPLKELALKLQQQGKPVVIRSLESRIGGRLMRRLTPMTYGPMYLAGMDTKAYAGYTDSYDQALDPKLKEKSLAVALARMFFILVVLGKRSEAALIYNQPQILEHSLTEIRQFIMEGANKKSQYPLIAHMNALPRDSEVLKEGVLPQSQNQIAFSVTTKAGENYASVYEDVEKTKQAIPGVYIETEKITPQIAAGLSSLYEDFIVHYTALTGQDPNSNPQVKAVRENTAANLAKLAKEKRGNNIEKVETIEKPEVKEKVITRLKAGQYKKLSDGRRHLKDAKIVLMPDDFNQAASPVATLEAPVVKSRNRLAARNRIRTELRPQTQPKIFGEGVLIGRQGQVTIPDPAGYSLTQLFDQGNLDELSREYFKTLYHWYQNPATDRPALVINTGENNGNFYPSARLTKDQRQQLLGAKGYAEIRAEIEADTQRPAYQLQLNSLDAGLGTNVGRERYVKEKLGRDKIGAKGTDLSFEGVVKVGDKDYLVSVAEVKLLRLIKEAKENHYNGKLHLEPILSDDSKPSYDTLLEKPYLTDLIEAKAEIRTYKQVLTELGIETSSLVAKFYPSLDKETKQPTYKRPGSGSHGEWGFKFLRKSLDYKADSDTARVIAFYNGDGTNNSPDRYIVEWMLKHNVPLALVSTTKAGIDFKGGQIGAERLSDGRYRIRMLERGSTLDGKTPTEQTKVFEAMGLPGGLGEAGQQYFNTNIVLINYSLVAKLLQDLLKEVFSGDVQKLQTILAPDLIANTKKGPDGKDYIQLEGPIGTSLINLNNYFALNQDNSKVKEIMQRYNVEKMLRIINVDTQNRSRFFTPIKFATDHWFQAHSDYYRLNTDTWMLEDTQPGMTPPIFNLEDSYYQDVSNVYEAFGRASVTGLTSLTIKGKPVKLADAILEGDVEIENQTGREVDLNDLNVEPSATYSVDHFLNEAVVRQLWEGDDWATEMLEENQAKTVFNNKQSARNFLEAVKILFSSDKPVISAGAKKILEYKSLPSILEVFTEGEYSWLREMLDVSPYFGVKLLPYNTSPHDGKIWNTLKDGKFKSGDEGKVVVTKHDPFTLRLAYHKPLDLQAELRLIMRSKDHQEPLSLETARKVEEGEITFYEWDIATAKYDGFLEFEFFITDETKGFRLPVARRYYEYIDKILPESVPTNKIEYKPVESLKDAKVVVLSMEANLLNKEVRNKALFGAIAGGLGVLMGNHLRALRYSGATAYFPLPIYSKGSYQWMEGNQQKVDDNYPLDYSVLLNGYEDEYEKWERIRHIPVVFKLAGQETAALAILMKLTLKNEPGLPESYVLFIDRMVTSQDVEFKLVKDVLYPDHPTSEARFTQAAFYSRAVLGALEALDITPDILQVHESYPAAALVPDLFYNPEYNKNGRFKSAKNNLMGFAHTVVPQAFPKYNPKFLKDILDLELDEIALNELLTPQSKEKRLYDPFYALSKKAVSVGTVGLEHLRVMRKSFPDFASKYFAVEDANWPFFWMLDEQRKRGGELLNKEEMWQAKQNAAKRMHE
ncbi:MAG: UTP--glucose-1-phosphate uridylyltransferase, partial [Candidatus Omnitrophica bacterium]|nr:UTP--glucose-1-phosphate uridylyltransferase [Candidatus Omnitrophota bacterium]